MGATVIKKGNSYRVRFRYKGLKDLSINFKDLDLARISKEDYEIISNLLQKYLNLRADVFYEDD